MTEGERGTFELKRYYFCKNTITHSPSVIRPRDPSLKARPAPFGLFPVLTAWVSTPRTVSFFKPLHRFIRIIHLTPLPSPSSTPLKMTRGGRRCLNRLLIRKHYLSCAFKGGEKMKPIFRSSPQAAPSKNSLHFLLAPRGISRVATRGCFAFCGTRPRLRLWKPQAFEKA